MASDGTPIYIKYVSKDGVEGELYLNRYGIRPGKEYAEENNNIFNSLAKAFGVTLHLPAGHFYFKDTLDFVSGQYSLCGDDSSFTEDTNTAGCT